MRLSWYKSLIGLLLLGGMLAGCSPAAGSSYTPGPTVVYNVPLPPTRPAAAAAGVPTKPGASDQAIAFTILYTNDVRGYIDPCG